RTAGPFEQRGRRFVWEAKRFGRQEVGMFQGVAAAKSGVAGRVGDRHPCRARCEVPVPLEAALLEFVVRFHEIVETKHELVIGGTPAAVRLEQADHAALPPTLEAERLWSR